MSTKQILPLGIISKTDVVRLQRELEALDETMRQNSLRKGGEAATLPKASVLIEELAELSNSNLLHEEDREKLLKFVTTINSTAPVIHVSFATTPSQRFLEKLVRWFRDEIHNTVLLQIGLQPGIAAGCIVRTPSKQFDFSLRHFLGEQQEMLIKAIQGGKNEHQ